MNIFSFTILLLAVVAYAQTTTLPVLGRLSNAERAILRRRIEAAGGCNANVCFAIDGSRSLTRAEFRAQKNFVCDVVSVIGIDDALEAAVCQFGPSASLIQPLTSNFRKFRCTKGGTTSGGAGDSFLIGGINCCFSQLARRPGETNKIVVLANGGTTIGSSAIRRANLFRSVTGGEICAIGAGDVDDFELLAIAGGDPNKVFKVDSFLDKFVLSRIAEDLVAGICNLPSE